MKDYLLLLTQYNYNANLEVIRILDGLPENERNADRKSFVGSLHGALDHIVEGALYFQKQIWSSFPQLTALLHKYSDFETTYRTINFPCYSELTTVLKICDQAFIGMFQLLSDEEMAQEIAVKAFHGDSVQTTYFIMLQYINHCTHHRGQISQILDEMNVENDYSGIHLHYD